jgi:uncharacterized membrane protein YdjX (TVP38/TMEM64 family)
MPLLSRLGLALAFLVLAASLYYLPLSQWVTNLVYWGQHHPVAGPIAYVMFVIVATVLFLPGSIAIMIGGFLFGFVPGLMLSVLAVPCGAQSAFEIGRWVTRPWVQDKLANNQRMHAIEGALAEHAFVIVVLTRLSLIIPFNLLNYAYGASSVRSATYLVATAVGMLPAIGLYVYLGTVARDLGQILSGQAARTEAGYWIVGAGIVAIGAAAWLIHRAATRALEKHLLAQQETEV